MLLLKLTPEGAIAAYPYQAGDLLADHPHTSFAMPLNPDDLADFGVFALTTTEAPAATLDTVVEEAPPALVDGVWTQQWATVTASPEVQTSRRQALAANIDAACAAITGRFLPFMREYEAREAQAQAYKDAGYTGTVPVRVSEFCTPAGMPASTATDLILSQAANLRAAEAALSGLRMRKYEVLGASTGAAAQAAYAAITAAIAAVGATV